METMKSKEDVRDKGKVREEKILKGKVIYMDRRKE
jgi:hypothetical protein